MNVSIHKCLFIILACFITIGIHSQEKVTEQSAFSNKKSFKDIIVTSSSQDSKTPIYKPYLSLILTCNGSKLKNNR